MKYLNGYKPCLIIGERAWLKTHALCAYADKEVAWHGMSYRDGDNYVIEDIVLYPQIVTGTSVTTDEEEYARWIMTLPDEVSTRLHMQGHSHVNMAVTPSVVDLAHQKEIVEELSEDGFYIFMILNKSGDMYVTIYDKRLQLQFATEDIRIVVPRNSIMRILDDYDSKVRNPNISPVIEWGGNYESV